MDSFFCTLDESKECTNCGECEMCDLKPDKVCDNCGKCIDSDADYRAIEVDQIQDGIIEE